MEIEQRVPPQVIGLLNLANLNNDNYGAFMQAWALKQALIESDYSHPESHSQCL